jgi:hypothetical protein
MNKRWTNKFYILTILFFTLGFFNIIFAWLGFLCMIIPFVLLAKDGKKTWCQNYCPRANLFTVLFKNKSLKGKTAPKWLTNGDGKRFFLIYFSFNLFILFMSTLMVFRGRIAAMEKVRFMIAFQLPWNIPQLLNISSIPNWAVHLSFRVYSMMFTTTVIGMILGFIYMPRTWCTICPINTISDIAINIKQKH